MEHSIATKADLKAGLISRDDYFIQFVDGAALAVCAGAFDPLELIRASEYFANIPRERWDALDFLSAEVRSRLDEAGEAASKEINELIGKYAAGILIGLALDATEKQLGVEMTRQIVHSIRNGLESPVTMKFQAEADPFAGISSTLQ